MAITMEDLNEFRNSIDKWTKNFEKLPKNLRKSPKHQNLPVSEIELMLEQNMDVLRGIVNNWIKNMSIKIDDRCKD